MSRRTKQWKIAPITSINDERLQERVNEAITERFGDVVNNSETER